MAKITLQQVGSLTNSLSAQERIDDNSTEIERAVENTLSRDGSLPNAMEADLDMDSNDILNVNRLDATEIYIGGTAITATGIGAWGSITGTLSNQTDLQSALNAKEATFSKGSLIQGSNVTLSGTLSNRLVGSGDVTISSSGGGVGGGSASWGEITGTLSDQSDLNTSLNGKAPLGGAGASGTWDISITGSAPTLTTSRTINGTSFNGSANITTTNWGTSRTLTLGASGKAVDGSANVSWTLAEMGAGDVVGPASATADAVAVYNGTTGKLLKDGETIASIRSIPQNSQSGAYTLVLADAGKHILHPSADTTARTFTLPANSSVAYPIGTAITIVNQNAAGVVTIAITTDTMRLAGAGTTGSRTLAANGVATLLKLTATEWIASGTGLT